jgi:DNA invertase Pin-like site-specific DNA recombinase
VPTEQHYCFRLLGHTNARVFQTRLKAAMTASGAGFRSLHDTWADTTTAHGRLMLTVLGGLVEFEREINPRPHERRPRPRRGERGQAWPKADVDLSREAIKRHAAGKETLGEIAPPTM